MSKELKTITGIKESGSSILDKICYTDSDLDITSFWGGNENGKMIQLTIGYDYVQFTRAQIVDLVQTLNNWL